MNPFEAPTERSCQAKKPTDESIRIPAWLVYLTTGYPIVLSIVLIGYPVYCVLVGVAPISVNSPNAVFDIVSAAIVFSGRILVFFYPFALVAGILIPLVNRRGAKHSWILGLAINAAGWIVAFVVFGFVFRG